MASLRIAKLFSALKCPFFLWRMRFNIHEIILTQPVAKYYRRNSICHTEKSQQMSLYPAQRSRMLCIFQCFGCSNPVTDAQKMVFSNYLMQYQSCSNERIPENISTLEVQASTHQIVHLVQTGQVYILV